MTHSQYHSETLAETAHVTRDTAPQNPVIRPMLRRIGKPVIGAVLAASLVFGSASHSLADKRGDDIAKVLGAALILGLIINNVDKSKAKAKPTPVPQPRPQPKPKPQHSAVPRVPSQCAISIDSNSGRAVTMYSESCLRDTGFNYRLPDCARPMRIYGQRDNVYSEQCLRDAGFRISGR